MSTSAGRITRRLLRPGVLVAVLVLLLVLAWAAVPGLFAHADPLVGDPADRLQAPNGQYWFGTDYLGRDLWSRVVHGTGSSLGTTALAVAIAFLAGSGLGLLSGSLGGPADTAIMRVVEVMQSIPSILLSMTVVAALGFGPVHLAAAVAVAAVPSFARVMRNEVLRWKSTLFVEAARLNGIGPVRTVLRHVLPHALGPALALAALEFGSAVIAVSALSFLGYGAPPPQPEWGLLVSEGRDYLASAWWMTVVPGLVITVVVLSVNVLARAASSPRRPS